MGSMHPAPDFREIHILAPSEETGLPLSPISEFALQLVGYADQRAYASGTAVVIAAGLLWTARHVFEDYWEKFENGSMPKSGAATVVHLFALQFLTPDRGNLWLVTKVWGCAHCDAVLLQIRPFSASAAAHRWRLPGFSALPPMLGSTVKAFGYWPNSFSGNRLGNEVTVNLDVRCYASFGTVQEIHHEKRDNIRLNFPCFRTNLQVEGGMSGGPVFDEHRRICGLVCDSLGQETSWVTTIWPVLTTETDFPSFHRPHGSRYPLYELAETGQMEVAGLESLLVNRDENGSTKGIGIRY
jgi:hypothetical protein